tara:strand:- start:95 stop:574 length:480 start_codon:yes stop_codon:yes gene_type:complete
MKLLRHPVAALVVFSIFILLFVSVYADFQQLYDFTPDQLKVVGNQTDEMIETYNLTGSGNIMDQFQKMKLIEGVNGLNDGITRLSSGNLADILGGLTAAGIGFAKLVTGLLVAPFAILHIITVFYGGAIFPVAIIKGLNALISIYIFFILLSAYLRSDI